jgi:flavin-dependent dehydrogenase
MNAWHRLIWHYKGKQDNADNIGGTKMEAQVLQLDDGSRVGVIGGGPAGSFFSIFILDMASRVGMDLQVDIYEPRDFSLPGPMGCNMCGGIISESLVQMLATEGIILPNTVVQRGIDSYMLHMDVGSVRIQTPLQEKRIGAVYRGPGPRDIKEIKWGSFDGHLQSLAIKKGANIIRKRVERGMWVNDRLQIETRGGSAENYDLLVLATGVNAAARRLLDGLSLDYQPPETTKTFIQEYYLGEDMIGEVLGSSMHVFLLDLPRLEFAAVIPKGDYVSVCLLGEDIDKELVRSFMEVPEVQGCFPKGWDWEEGSCGCAPRINVKGAFQPFADRVVFIGDCGVTRLYKDGIGAAYRTAKAAATTAVFQGVSAKDFERHYWPACRSIEIDNQIGQVIFLVTRLIQKQRIARRAVLRMTAEEQQKAGSQRRMSMVLWDMFTGSATYKDIFLRTLNPKFWARLIGDLAVSAIGR